MATENTKIYKSLAEFQQECPVIHKGTSGYGYSYADLPTIFSIINPILYDKQLGFTQLDTRWRCRNYLISFIRRNNQKFYSDTSKRFVERHE